ncbi:MAG: anhydro-N-acetylmuramic acid kinase [Hydrogenophilaceae bacterium]|nr:anhydro-N-acetylmuramic acid kinase [Hydrogenophilaceae bacterium]
MASRHVADLFIGVMSGTSLDGVDAALVRLSSQPEAFELLGAHYLNYPDDLKARLLALHASQPDEIHVSLQMANELARLYAKAVRELTNKTNTPSSLIHAIGCHGQTIRHRPDAGYSLQIVNGALLAELTGITTVTDFRSRDIAAGGQGAPLVPAFHASMLSSPEEHRVIVNIGGIANLTSLPCKGKVFGFDCGPGNMLMDAWAARHLGKPVDENGAWAARGKVQPALLTALLQNPFFAAPAPKSAGREQFNIAWLDQSLSGDEAPEDVQATLLELTARGIVDAAKTHCAGYDALYVCGGGVHNLALLKRLEKLAKKPVNSTSAIGIDPDWMEAIAFAWLAKQCIEGKPGNLPAVTGAAGPRILGAIYPA